MGDWKELGSDELELVLQNRAAGQTNIRSLVKNLPKDPDNPGSVLGWAVVKNDPWTLVDIYPTKDAAEAVCSAKGAGFSVSYGSHQVGSDNFIGGGTPPSP